MMLTKAIGLQAERTHHTKIFLYTKPLATNKDNSFCSPKRLSYVMNKERLYEVNKMEYKLVGTHMAHPIYK